MIMKPRLSGWPAADADDIGTRERCHASATATSLDQDDRVRIVKHDTRGSVSWCGETRIAMARSASGLITFLSDRDGGHAREGFQPSRHHSATSRPSFKLGRT
jgi:hypothetical protein